MTRKFLKWTARGTNRNACRWANRWTGKSAAYTLYGDVHENAVHIQCILVPQGKRCTGQGIRRSSETERAKYLIAFHNFLTWLHLNEHYGINQVTAADDGAWNQTSEFKERSKRALCSSHAMNSEPWSVKPLNDKRNSTHCTSDLPHRTRLCMLCLSSVSPHQIKSWLRLLQGRHSTILIAFENHHCTQAMKSKVCTLPIATSNRFRKSSLHAGLNHEKQSFGAFD